MFIIKPVTFVPTAHFIVPQCTKNLFVQCQHLKHITGLVSPFWHFFFFLSVLRALLMEASWRQWAQGHPANPGRPRARTHFSGQSAFFFKIVVSWDVQLWMSPALLLFLLFKMENLVVLIPGEFYIFATFFSLYLHFPHTHWPGSGCLGRGHALLILGGENVIKHKTLTLSDSQVLQLH